jgi:hypothetical protein
MDGALAAEVGVGELTVESDMLMLLLDWLAELKRRHGVVLDCL